MNKNEGGGNMAENIYEQLKKAMKAKVDQVKKNEVNDIIGNIQDGTAEEIELRKKFAAIMEDRQEMFGETEKLLQARLELYQTVISLVYLTHYFNDVENQIYNATVWFRLLEFSRSSEFITMLETLRRGIDDSSVDMFKTYFRERFDELKELLAPFRDIRMNKETDEAPTLQENTGTSYEDIEPENPERPEDYLLYTLGFIYMAVDDDGYKDTINSIIDFVSTSNSNLGRITFDRIQEIVTTMKTALRRFIIIDKYRAENDAAYTGKYLQSLLEKIEVYEYNISIFSSITDKTIEEIKEDESYALFFISAQEIRNDINVLLDETIKSIKEINGFFENYSVFLRLPEDTIRNITNTIDEVLPNFKENLSDEDREYFDEDIVNEDMISVDSNQPDIKLFIEDMMEMVVADELVFQYKDITNMLMLYLGLQLLKKNLTYTNYSYINYPLYNLVNKKIIIESQVNVADFNTTKELEQNLAETYEIYIRKDITKELISPSLKNLFKKLRIIDMVDISTVLDYNIGYNDSDFESVSGMTYYNLSDDTWREYTTSWIDIVSPTEGQLEFSNFIHTMYVNTLEALLENKKYLNENLLKLLEIYSVRGNNFKSVFIEMIVRKAVSAIVNYANGKQTILKDITPIISYINDTEIDTINQKIIKDYKIIRSKFYTESVNIIDDILDPVSDLSVRLKQEYE
jgi:hypothetical protein